MYEFKTPDYHKDNIVNLMSSISNSFGKTHDYNQLEYLSGDTLKDFDNIVLIVVDGLGYNYLKTQEHSFLYKNIHAKLTTTFLSTTACANTVFQVGYPLQQHGLTGWTMYLKEIGGITKVLPFTLEVGEDISGLEECLTLPVAGEPRVRDCFVKPSKVKDFEKIIETQMSKYCWCFKGEQLIKDNFYGLGLANKKLYDRVGDYVLIMKENYVLKNNNDYSQKSSHGSFSDDEMLVPLVVIDC